MRRFGAGSLRCVASSRRLLEQFRKNGATGTVSGEFQNSSRSVPGEFHNSSRLVPTGRLEVTGTGMELFLNCSEVGEQFDNYRNRSKISVATLL